MPDAGANITAMIVNAFAQSPGTTVILATILVNPVAAQDECRVTVNAQVWSPILHEPFVRFTSDGKWFSTINIFRQSH